MLVLTRKKEEAVLIGKDIKIVIFDIDGDRVKIGIDAPKELSICREELLKEVSKINTEAQKIDVKSFEELVKVYKNKK